MVLITELYKVVDGLFRFISNGSCVAKNYFPTWDLNSYVKTVLDDINSGL